MRSNIVLLATALFLGCASQQNQAVTAKETACQHYISVLHADHDLGMTCSDAKKHAESLEPTCKLIFTCNEAKDGGSE